MLRPSVRLVALAGLAFLAVGCAESTGIRISGTLPPITLVIETREAAVGDTVEVTTSGWRDTLPLTYYLVTAAERRTGILGADKVELGQVVPDKGDAHLDFELKERYQTTSGAHVEIKPGEELYIFVQQGGRARSTGPLVVK